MSEPRAQTIYRVIREVTALQGQMETLHREMVRLRETMLQHLLTERRLFAEKQTLMESVARLTLRAQGLPTREGEPFNLDHPTEPLFICRWCHAPNASIYTHYCGDEATREHQRRLGGKRA